VSFQGRDITDRHDLRYKGCPIEKSVMNYKHILYGIDQCPGTRVVVVEGIVDVWRLGDGFAGSFGTSMTSFQTRLLTRFDEVLFLFDGEPEAQAKAREYASELASMGKYTEVMSLGEGKDPGDLNEKEAGYVRKQIFGGM
jgi:DNA primase